MASAQYGSLRAALRQGIARRVSAVLALVLLGAGAGAALGWARSGDVSAESQLLVAPLSGNPFSPTSDDLVNLETEAQLVRSDPVGERVLFVLRQEMGSDTTVPSLLSGLDVSVLPNTQILAVTYTSSSATLAREVAQTFAEQYLDYRAERSDASARAQIERIEEQIAAQQEQLDAFVQQLGDAPSANQQTILREQISGVNARIGQLQTQLDEVRTDTIDPGQVTSPASVVSASRAVMTVIFGAAGALGGLAIALGLVVVRVRAENKLHLVEDIEAIGLVPLGEVTCDVIGGTEDEVLTGSAGAAVPAELRHVRVALLSRVPRRPVRVLFGSADADVEARCALSIAAAAAASGYRTLLVDATSGGLPALAPRGAGEEFRPGLFSVLGGEVPLEQAIDHLNDNLTVIARGAEGPHDEDRLTGPEVSRLFERLSDVADLIFVAGGHLMDTRTQAVALVCDAVVAEATMDSTSLDDLVGISNDLDPGSLVGVVCLIPGTGRKTSGDAAGRAATEAKSRRRRHRAVSPSGHG